MNLRNPMPLKAAFVNLQNKYLQEELAKKGIVDVNKLPVTSVPKVALWKGDITRLRCDAIVNAASPQMLGCFVPGHNCVDNCIHSAAGLQLREECFDIVKRQNREEPPGHCQLTKGYNLPSSYVLHTVGPIVNVRPTNKNKEELASCYRSCLDLARNHHLRSLAFPCISTGAFSYPHQEAAEIAVTTIENYLNEYVEAPAVIFDVFLDEDYKIYSDILS